VETTKKRTRSLFINYINKNDKNKNPKDAIFINWEKEIW
jgi:hypothetical protein